LAIRQPRRIRVLGVWLIVDAHHDPLAAGRPSRVDALLLHVLLEVMPPDVSHLAACHFPQRDQVAVGEELVERTLGTLGGIDVAVAHALA
jgi:hypothetical protein